MSQRKLQLFEHGTTIVVAHTKKEAKDLLIDYFDRDVADSFQIITIGDAKLLRMTTDGDDSFKMRASRLLRMFAKPTIIQAWS